MTSAPSRHQAAPDPLGNGLSGSCCSVVSSMLASLLVVPRRRELCEDERIGPLSLDVLVL